jgi:gliding motility-associated-like protein
MLGYIISDKEDINVEEYEMIIFNRWGEELFRTNDTSKGWDGTYNGTPPKQDIYIWVANYKVICGTQRIQRKTGFVMLLP